MPKGEKGATMGELKLDACERYLRLSGLKEGGVSNRSNSTHPACDDAALRRIMVSGS
ncbi:hypothetical protein [Caulobacter sp. RL271]|jgi:hypothetical protein|uniref:Uncharacterized protein n=1 Tax=Caulobacter segnis TaxID=88688 RepID=A0ABY4ZZL0_9CAUL|nr:hypothetical protein [Caulobacter segnis]USQ98105.1 hypothetical protein MZV50_11415 [Caulobacter segnis]